MAARESRPCRPRRPAWVVAAGLLALGVGGALAFVAAASLGPLAVPGNWALESDQFEYTAVLHVHSEHSHDGRGSIEEIAAAAGRAGVQVVLLTDHNTLAPLVEGREGWYGDTLILVGMEVTTGSGYLLVLDPSPDLPTRARGFAVDDLVRRYGEGAALVLLAHPEHPRLGWRGPLPPVDGLEVIDVFDQLMAAPLRRKALGLAAYPANPVMAILSWVHWPRSVLARWDEMMQERRTVGVLALDAHGGIAITEETDLAFPSHETAFRIGRLHLLMGKPLRRDAEDRVRVYRSIRAGRFFNAFDGFAPADGFRFQVWSGGRRALMGEKVRFQAGAVAELRVPPAGESVARLVRDGRVVHEGPAAGALSVPLPGPGVYRVEVDLRVDLFPIGGAGFRPWIFSNAVYVNP